MTAGRTRDRFSAIELAIVVGVAFGDAIFYSIQDVLHGTTVGADDTAYVGDHQYMVGLAAYELMLLPLVAAILYVGGWQAKDFRLGISLRSTAIGVAAFAAMWILDDVLVWLMKAMFPWLVGAIDQWDAYRPAHPPSLGAVLFLAIVNPVFEETIACAYVIKSLRGRFGLQAGIWASVAIRASYHLYQGLTAAPLHITYGLVQAHIYVRYGRLWPLILSHFLFNFVGEALRLFWP